MSDTHSVDGMEDSMDEMLATLMNKLDEGLTSTAALEHAHEIDMTMQRIVIRATNGCDAPNTLLVRRVEESEVTDRRALILGRAAFDAAVAIESAAYRDFAVQVDRPWVQTTARMTVARDHDRAMRHDFVATRGAIVAAALDVTAHLEMSQREALGQEESAAWAGLAPLLEMMGRAANAASEALAHHALYTRAEEEKHTVFTVASAQGAVCALEQRHRGHMYTVVLAWLQSLEVIHDAVIRSRREVCIDWGFGFLAIGAMCLRDREKTSRAALVQLEHKQRAEILESFAVGWGDHRDELERLVFVSEAVGATRERLAEWELHVEALASCCRLQAAAEAMRTFLVGVAEGHRVMLESVASDFDAHCLATGEVYIAAAASTMLGAHERAASTAFNAVLLQSAEVHARLELLSAHASGLSRIAAEATAGKRPRPVALPTLPVKEDEPSPWATLANHQKTSAPSSLLHCAESPWHATDRAGGRGASDATESTDDPADGSAAAATPPARSAPVPLEVTGYVGQLLSLVVTNADAKRGSSPQQMFVDSPKAEAPTEEAADASQLKDSAATDVADAPSGSPPPPPPVLRLGQSESTADDSNEVETPAAHRTAASVLPKRARAVKFTATIADDMPNRPTAQQQEAATSSPDGGSIDDAVRAFERRFRAQADELLALLDQLPATAAGTGSGGEAAAKEEMTPKDRVAQLMRERAEALSRSTMQPAAGKGGARGAVADPLARSARQDPSKSGFRPGNSSLRHNPPNTTPPSGSLRPSFAAHRRRSSIMLDVASADPQPDSLSGEGNPDDEALGSHHSSDGDSKEKKEPEPAAKRVNIMDLLDHLHVPTRGVSERHPVIAFLDVSFVFMGMLSCIAASFQIHPRAAELGDTMTNAAYLAYWNAFSELYSMLWIASRFFLSKRRGEWEIVDDLTGIRTEYLKTWFVYDLLYALPLDFIFAGWQWEIYQYISVRHFLRLPRIFALGKSANPLLGSRLWYRFLSFCMWMLLTIHILACIFWALEDGYNYDQALYWAIATCSTVGYGDVYPTHFTSRVYVTAALLVGAATLASMNAFATLFLRQKDRLQQEEDLKKQLVNSMLDYYSVPWNVQLEVIAATPAMIEHDNEEAFKEMISSLPAFVSKKVDSYIRVKLLKVIPVFNKLTNMDELLSLTECLTQQFYPAGATVIEQGERDRQMYFLVRGVVEVVLLLDPYDLDGDGDFEAMVTAVLHPGAFFGEAALLQPVERKASVQAVTVVEVLNLTFDAFDGYREAFPSAWRTLTHALGVANRTTEAQLDNLLAVHGKKPPPPPPPPTTPPPRALTGAANAFANLVAAAMHTDRPLPVNPLDPRFADTKKAT